MKLARKYDPDGIRTLGVVTKCDDAASAEASDIVDKAGFPISADQPVTSCISIIPIITTSISTISNPIIT